MGVARIYVPIRSGVMDELFDAEARSKLSSLGRVTVDVDPTEEELVSRVGDSEVLVLHNSSPRLPTELCLTGTVRMIAYAGGSVRRMVPRTLVDHGVVVSQAAGAMAPAVAEMSLTLALVLLRHVHMHDRVLQTQRDWPTARQAGLGNTLRSRRVGIVGASRTGVEYIHLVRGMVEHPILVYDPYLSDHQAGELGVTSAGLDDLFTSSDLVAVHAPTLPETHNMVGARQLALLPNDAILVNTARSWVVDEHALLAELVAGRLRAGLDVFDTEPLPGDSPFYGLANVVLSPHRAGATVQTRHLQGRIVVDEVSRFLSGEALQHAVTTENYHRLA